MSRVTAKRWLPRIACIAILALLGWGIYVATPPEPICVINNSDQFRPVEFHFLDGGSRLVTLPNSSNTAWGPLQIWDAHTGAEIARPINSDAPIEKAFPFSPDGRFFAATVSTKSSERTSLLLLDLKTERLRLLGIEDPSTSDSWVTYSPSGEFLIHFENRSALSDKILGEDGGLNQ